MPHLKRLDFDLGQVQTVPHLAMPSADTVKQAWLSDKAIVLPALLIENMGNHAENIEKSHKLM
ncbi:MAG: hypothetical protein L3J61_00330, partial [Ghiorsea sp.]|nr:hypothetical protein [Ghiorsea sp.]